MKGEFDNECVAMAAFCTAFWLWCRCVRHSTSWPWAVPAALAYVSCMHITARVVSSPMTFWPFGVGCILRTFGVQRRALWAENMCSSHVQQPGVLRSVARQALWQLGAVTFLFAPQGPGELLPSAVNTDARRVKTLWLHVTPIKVNNLIALHAAVLVGLGKYNTGLYRSYSIWCLCKKLIWGANTFISTMGLAVQDPSPRHSIDMIDMYLHIHIRTYAHTYTHI